MKTSKRLISIILTVVLALSLCVSAWAKTSSEEIPAPSGDAVVFSVEIGTKTVNFTQNDITGKGSFQTSTGSYAAKVDNVQTTQNWTGVMLADLLFASEKKLDITLPDDAKISAVAADGFISAFTVSEVRDADNRYMVAPDAVSNFDGETTYPNSYARILRGDADTLSNQANIRCVTGVRITNADGSSISTSSNAGSSISTGKKTQGGDIKNAVFYIAVKESAESAYKFYYYTREDLNSYDDIHDFDYTDHSVDKTVSGRGASLSNLLADIADATITPDMIVQYAESDGYHADAATAIEDSAYKDKVCWLTDSHVTTGGDTAPAVETVICLTSWTTFDTPTENNVNSVAWVDADDNSGYLRAYRQRDDANSAVIKTLMGVVVSYDGQQFTGKDGYTLSAESVSGNEMQIIEPSTGKVYTSQEVTGLVPGMKWTVSAPEIAGATVSGDSMITVTAAAGTTAKAVFTYKEGVYLTINGKDYTRSGLASHTSATQTPSKDEVSAHGTPYGYYDAMYYRYNGVWLNDLVSGDVTVTDASGKTVQIPAADLEKYFVATGYTASKSDTNVSEGKRFTYAYEAPRLIIPGDGTLVGEAEAKNSGNKMVTEVLKSVSAISGKNAASKFNDLAGYAWAENAINALSERGVVSGTGNGKYTPAANIKRGDFILMLYRAYGFTSDSKDNFADVKAGAYYYDAIAAAKELGIAAGDGTNFYPESAITRQEAMTLIYRTLKAVGKDLSAYSGDLSSFKDSANVASWAVDAVSALVGAGVINGANGNINPSGNMTRAEMAVALYRALDNIK